MDWTQRYAPPGADLDAVFAAWRAGWSAGARRKRVSCPYGPDQRVLMYNWLAGSLAGQQEPEMTPERIAAFRARLEERRRSRENPA